MAIRAHALGVGMLLDGFSDLKDAAQVQTWVVGTRVEYSVYLEFGTSRMPPYPFMRPAVEHVMSNEADAIADQADSVGEVISGIAKAIERRAKHYATTGVPPGPDVQSGTLRSSIQAKRRA